MRPLPTAQGLLVAALLTAFAPAWAAGDPANGETLYNLNCAYCHSLVEETANGRAGGRNQNAELLQQFERRSWRPSEPVTRRNAPPPKMRRGPHLAGLLQRRPGAVANFPYRFVWRIEGPTWRPADLDAYIAFHARLGDSDRADLVAYLTRATNR